ncbi:hypothetical protein [Yersinia bercovieri]|uniref:hypothetical protein n=1 Tax=Yersinia bercovieri TaxID=634 RepID=UPI0005E23B5F|nr:hypothetical protein [Yersinia bercovieri]CFQ35095.1 Uncharacterised protein [Yersinia bercovieri]
MDYNFENEYNSSSLSTEVTEDIKSISEGIYIDGAHRADFSPDYILKSYKVSNKVAKLMRRHGVYGRSDVAALCILEKLKVDDHSLEYVAKGIFNFNFDAPDFIKMVKCGVKDIETYLFYKEIIRYKKEVREVIKDLLQPKEMGSYVNEQSYYINKYPEHSKLINSSSSRGMVHIGNLASLIVLSAHKLTDDLLISAKEKNIENHILFAAIKSVDSHEVIKSIFIDLGKTPITEKEFIDVTLGKLTIDEIKFDYNEKTAKLQKEMDDLNKEMFGDAYLDGGHAVDSAILSDATAAMPEFRDELLSFAFEKRLNPETTAIPSSLFKAIVPGH